MTSISFSSAISRAGRELDRGPHDEDPEWILFMSTAEMTGHAAMGHVNLGRPARGEDLYRTVLAGDTLSVRNRAYYQALLAHAVLNIGDLDRAVEEGQAVLPAFDDGLMSARALNELRPLRSAAPPTAEEFRARYDRVAFPAA